MKKLITSILIIVLVMSSCVLLLSACKDPIDYSHTIVFYSQMGSKNKTITQNAIDAFEAKYPGWKISHETQGDYDDIKKKINSDFISDLQPDLAFCYADHVAGYIETGKVVKLNELIASTDKVSGAKIVDGKPVVAGKDENGKDTYEMVEYAVGYDDKEWADFEDYVQEGYAKYFTGYAENGYGEDDLLILPFVKSTEVLYYNKDALDACGLTPAKTWDELWAQCAKLKDKYPTATPLGYDSESNWFITMCAQNNWDYTSTDVNNQILFDNENTRTWLGTLKEKYDAGWITTKEEYGGTYTSDLFTRGADAGGIIYCVGSSGGASYQNPNGKFNWGVTQIPGSGSGDNINRAAISQGPSLCILSGGHNVENVDEKVKMTWLFVKELMDVAFQAEYAQQTGYMPVRKSAYEDEDYAAFLKKTNDIVAVTAGVARQSAPNFFTSPAFVKSSEARTQVGNALLYALTGQKSPEKALSDAFNNAGGKRS